MSYVRRLGEAFRQSIWLLPMVAVLVFFAVTAVHYQLLINAPSETVLIRLGDALAVKREVWKELWIGGSMSLCLAAIGSIFHSTYILIRLNLSRYARMLLISFCLILIFLGLSLWYRSGTGYAFEMTGGYAARVLSGLRTTEIQGRVTGTLIISSSLAFGAMVFIVSALSGLMHPRDSEKPELVAERVRLFNNLLYLSVGLTLTAVWMIFGIFHWAASLAGPGEIKNAAIIADTVVVLAGLFYSIILVVAFVPTATALQGMMDTAFRNRIGENVKYDDWRNSMGFSDMPLTTVRTYVTLGAPLISGLCASLAKSVLP
jgi:hypothetical protein